jgi:hypothetical protein
MKATLSHDLLENFGSLITLKGTNECLGDLMHFAGKGTYDPTHGLVPVTEAEAEIHNKCLDQARLNGLDANCQVGQGGYAYLHNGPGHDGKRVQTFSGTIISDIVRIKQGKKFRTIYFHRKGRSYQGRQGINEDIFRFRRVS